MKTKGYFAKLYRVRVVRHSHGDVTFIRAFGWNDARRIARNMNGVTGGAKIR